MEDILYWSFVHSLWGIGRNKDITRLLVEIKGAEFWKLNSKEITSRFPFISQEMADELTAKKQDFHIDDEYYKINKHNVKIISILSQEYPKTLRQIASPPPLLYVRGSLLKDPLSIAVVGARKATFYGRKCAEQLSFQLGKNGVQIISGLARGIDSSGHQGAIKAKASTIAVLGSGVDVIYPRENVRLYNEIIASGEGAVISEFPMGTSPLKINFPIRNRLISGLSDGIIIIEAGEKSGSLITAEFGLEQGKDIFVVPGPIDNPLYKGSHKLIKEGAKLIDSIEDILEEYGQMSLLKEFADTKVNLSPEETAILNLLSSRPISPEEILKNSSFTTQKILSILGLLEIKGLIKRVAGRKFISIS
ncbi:MAG: DNA-processing protein DprA [Bacillota bacterium]